MKIIDSLKEGSEMFRNAAKRLVKRMVQKGWCDADDACMGLHAYKKRMRCSKISERKKIVRIAENEHTMMKCE